MEQLSLLLGNVGAAACDYDVCAKQIRIGRRK